jgi:uncharacterized coiled-coil protein SlyX
MQLEKLWFDSFAAAAQAQRNEDRGAAIRDSSRRMLRAVKRRVTPQFAHSQPITHTQPQQPTHTLAEADAGLRAQVAEAERAVQELSDAVAKQRASVLLVVRERAEKKMRLLYDAPVARLTTQQQQQQQQTNVSNSDINLASVCLINSHRTKYLTFVFFFFFFFFQKKGAVTWKRRRELRTIGSSVERLYNKCRVY